MQNAVMADDQQHEVVVGTSVGTSSHSFIFQAVLFFITQAIEQRFDYVDHGR